MYYLVEGAATVVLRDRRVEMRAGDVLCVAAGEPSAVEGTDPAAGFKLLRVAVPTNK